MLPHGLQVGLQHYVHEGLHQVEDQPDINHLDVGGGGKLLVNA